MIQRELALIVLMTCIGMNGLVMLAASFLDASIPWWGYAMLGYLSARIIIAWDNSRND